jgi:hypothetical protein
MTSSQQRTNVCSTVVLQILLRHCIRKSWPQGSCASVKGVVRYQRLQLPVWQRRLGVVGALNSTNPRYAAAAKLSTIPTHHDEFRNATVPFNTDKGPWSGDGISDRRLPHSLGRNSTDGLHRTSCERLCQSKIPRSVLLCPRRDTAVTEPSAETARHEDMPRNNDHQENSI